MTRLTLNIADPSSGGAAPAVKREGSCACGGGCGGGADREVRCDCGSLLARVVGAEVELKCRRCKRTWRIPIARGG